jgi:predicted GNAT family acetyltransferase
MPDMLVNLYQIKDEIPNIKELENSGVVIKRALAPDKHKIIEYVRNTFDDWWASECDVAFSNKPISCFIAVKNKNVIGFACYDATGKGYFGPTGVTEENRGKGIGNALLLKSLLSMKEEGYGYAIIGWTDDAIEFYKKAVRATVIENSTPGIYKRMINID